MKRRDVVSLIALAVTIIVGSSTIKSELLTNYEITPKEVHPDQNTILSITNIGWFQADNVAVVITTNGTIDDFTDMCIEGKMLRFDNKTLVAKFQRMSPQVDCHFELTVSESVSLSYEVNSDGRLTPWFGWPPISVFLMILFIIMAIPTIVLIFSLKGLFGSNEWYDYFVKYEKKFNEIKGADNTREFVRAEYGHEIGRADATILRLIYHGKTTKSQLMVHSGLSSRQVSHRIRKMRQYELISEGKIELNKTLHNHFTLIQWNL